MDRPITIGKAPGGAHAVYGRRTCGRTQAYGARARRIARRGRMFDPASTPSRVGLNGGGTPQGATLSRPEPCLGCDIGLGAVVPPGGILLREGGFAIHALADRSPIRGWLVLTSERHARAWYDLPPDELSRLGPLAARVMAAQRDALGAEHVYAFAIGDVLRHFHLHLVPRFADTPERLRGRRCFEGGPGDMLADVEAAHAARAVAAALARCSERAARGLPRRTASAARPRARRGCARRGRGDSDRGRTAPPAAARSRAARRSTPRPPAAEAAGRRFRGRRHPARPVPGRRGRTPPRRPGDRSSSTRRRLDRARARRSGPARRSRPARVRTARTAGSPRPASRRRPMRRRAAPRAPAPPPCGSRARAASSRRRRSRRAGRRRQWSR